MNASELETTIAAAQAGLGEGYQRLFSEFGGMVYNLIRHMMADRGEAEELTQDVFLQAFSALAEYRKQGAGFPAWICRIAYNMAISHLRKSRLQVVSLEDANISVPDESSDSSDDKIEELMQAIELLPEEEKALLQLFYFDELSLQEIAYITSCSAAAVAMRLMRIRKKLRNQIESEHLYGKR